MSSKDGDWIKLLSNHPCFKKWKKGDSDFDYSEFYFMNKRGSYKPPARVVANSLFKVINMSDIADGQVKSKKSIESFYRGLKRDKYRVQYLSKVQIFARWLAEQCAFEKIVGLYATCDDAFEKFLIYVADQVASKDQKEHTLRGYQTCLKKCFESCNINVSTYSLNVIKNRRKKHKKDHPSTPRYQMPFNMLCELVLRQFEAFYTVIRGGVVKVDRKTQSGNSKKTLSKAEVIRDTINMILIVLAINRPSDNLVFVDAVSYDEEEKCWIIKRGGVMVRVANEELDSEEEEEEEYKVGQRKGDGGKTDDEVRIYDAEDCFINPSLVFKEWLKLIGEFDNKGKGKDKLLKQLNRSGDVSEKNLGSRSVSSLISQRFKEIIDGDDFPSFLKEKLPKNFKPFAYLLRYATITGARKSVRDEKTGATLISDVDVAHNADHKIKGTSATNVYTGKGGEEMGFSFGVHMLVGMNKYVEEMYEYDDTGVIYGTKRSRPRTVPPPDIRNMLDNVMQIRDEKEKNGELRSRKTGKKRRRRIRILDDDSSDEESPLKRTKKKKKKDHAYPSYPMMYGGYPQQPMMMFQQPMIQQPMMYQQPMMAPMMMRPPVMRTPMMMPYQQFQPNINEEMKKELQKLEKRRMEIMRGDYEE